jgi:long-chain fatty acid transport protein
VIKHSFASRAALLLSLAVPGTAMASTGVDSPDSGALQVGRGSAWVARADDPLAAYFNPAALAWQATGVHLGAHLIFIDRCFTRLGPDLDGDGKGDPVSPGNSLPGPGAEGGPPAEVCADAPLFPNPQIAATFRILDNLAIGVAVVAPHGVGNVEWPETLEYQAAFGPAEQPYPGRYMLQKSNSILLNPTLSVAYAPTDWLALGVGLIWGVASVEFENFAQALSTLEVDDFDAHDDVKARLTATDAFIPGFVIGGLWQVTDRFDLGVWYKWQDAIESDADIYLESRYWDSRGRKNADPCPPPETQGCNITDPTDKDARLKFPNPMEAKIGVRYHHPRAGARPTWAGAAGAPRKVRDPMSEDLFDVEVDFTWANNSAVENIELRFRSSEEFPGDPIKVAGTPGEIPGNGDIPHEWKDVVGVRLGGDFVVLPSRLAVRAGGFVETKGQNDEYLNLDFHVGEKVGLALGATVRLGPVDVTGAFQHTFFGDIDNNGNGKLRALSGDATDTLPQPYRSRQFVNGGVLSTSLNEVALGGTLRF